MSNNTLSVDVLFSFKGFDSKTFFLFPSLICVGRGQINPATNFSESNAIASFAARTGLLAAFPEPLYQIAQVWLDILVLLTVHFLRSRHFLEFVVVQLACCLLHRGKDYQVHTTFCRLGCGF